LYLSIQVSIQTFIDRLGHDGRIGDTSLFTIDLNHYGQLDNWTASATRLLGDRMIDAATLDQVRLLSTFGALMGNTVRSEFPALTPVCLPVASDGGIPWPGQLQAKPRFDSGGRVAGGLSRPPPAS